MTTDRSWTPRSPIGRREFLRLAGFGAGAALLAACAPAATPTAAPTSAPAATSGAAATSPPAATTAPAGPTDTLVPTAFPTAAPGQTAINFWIPNGSQTYCNGFDTIGANFNKAEPSIIVDKTCSSGGTAASATDFDTILQAA